MIEISFLFLPGVKEQVGHTWMALGRLSLAVLLVVMLLLRQGGSSVVVPLWVPLVVARTLVVSIFLMVVQSVVVCVWIWFFDVAAESLCPCARTLPDFLLVVN